MSYIHALRQLVGNRPLIMVGATILIVDTYGRLFLLRRADNGCWGVPGGYMEPGESSDETAQREALEETGLRIGEMVLFGVFSGSELYYRYPNGDEVYIVSVVYVTNDFSGELRFDKEHTDARYFNILELPSQFSPPIKPIIKRFVQTRSWDHKNGRKPWNS